jgi:hypothetical protein
MTDRAPRQDPAPPPPWQPTAPPSPTLSYPSPPGGEYPAPPGPGGPGYGGPVPVAPGGYPGPPPPAGPPPAGPPPGAGAAPSAGAGGPSYPGGPGGFTPQPGGWGGQPGPAAQPSPSSGPTKSARAWIDNLVVRPGAMVAWAAALGVAVVWIGTAIYGLAHGQFETGRVRLSYFLGVGDFTYAVALAVGLLALVLVPAAARPVTAPPGDDGVVTTRAGVQPEDRLLVLVLGVGGLVVAAAAVIVFLSDLSDIGQQPAISLSDGVKVLGAIPLGLAVALWARSLLPGRPRPAAATATPPAQAPYGPYGPPGAGPPPPYSQPGGPQPAGPGQAGSPGQPAPYGPPYGQGQNPPPPFNQPPPFNPPPPSR